MSVSPDESDGKEQVKAANNTIDHTADHSDRTNSSHRPQKPQWRRHSSYAAGQRGSSSTPTTHGGASSHKNTQQRQSTAPDWGVPTPAYQYAQPVYDPSVGGLTPLQRFLPSQLLMSSPFVQSPDGFPDSPVYYPAGTPVMAPQRRASQPVYYCYDGYGHPYIPSPTIPYLRHRGSSPGPMTGRHRHREGSGASRRLLSSLAQVRGETAEGTDSTPPSSGENGAADDGEHPTATADDVANSSTSSVKQSVPCSTPDLSKVLARDVEEEESPLQYPASPSPQVEMFDLSAGAKRTVRLQNLGNAVTAKQILSLVEFGPIESCRIVESGKTDTDRDALLTFVSAAITQRCLTQMKESLDNLRGVLESPQLQVDLTLTEPMNEELRNAVQVDGATRAVCIVNLPGEVTQEKLRGALRQFGEIETVRYKLSRNAIFVYFTSIEAAVNCMQAVQEAREANTTQDTTTETPANSTAGTVDTETAATSTATADQTDDTDILPVLTQAEISYAVDKNAAQGYGVIHPAASLGFGSCSTPSTSALSQDTSSSFSDPSTHSGSSGVADFTSFTGAEFVPYIHNGAAFAPSAGAVPGAVGGPIYSRSNLSVDMGPTAGASANVGNRTVYLGGLESGTSEEDVCNAVRGGMLESVKLLRDRRVCFVTFLRTEDAAAFIARASSCGFFVKSKCLKVAWGRNPGPIHPEVMAAVEEGASRNLYIGIVKKDDEQKDDENEGGEKDDDKKDGKESHEDQEDNISSDIPPEDILRRDFSSFGGIEQINFFEDRRCAFVNFFSIQSCMKAVEAFNGPEASKVQKSFHERYAPFKIAFGKDRCGGPPKKRKHKKRKQQTWRNGKNGRRSSHNSGTRRNSSRPHGKDYRAALDTMQIHSRMLGEEEGETLPNKGSQLKDSKHEPLHSGSTKKPSNERRPSYGRYMYYQQQGRSGAPAQPPMYIHGGYSVSSPQLVTDSRSGYFMGAPQMYYPVCSQPNYPKNKPGKTVSGNSSNSASFTDSSDTDNSTGELIIPKEEK